jgi:hypothetical protein
MRLVVPASIKCLTHCPSSLSILALFLALTISWLMLKVNPQFVHINDISHGKGIHIFYPTLPMIHFVTRFVSQCLQEIVV